MYLASAATIITAAAVILGAAASLTTLWLKGWGWAALTATCTTVLAVVANAFLA